MNVPLLLDLIKKALDEVASEDADVKDPTPALDAIHAKLVEVGREIDKYGVQLDQLGERLDDLRSGCDPMEVENDHEVSDHGDGEPDDGEDCEIDLAASRVASWSTPVPASQPKPWRDE